MTSDQSKNIVVCCDGTGNKLDVSRTNVVRFFWALDRSNPDEQVAYYHPGVGTMPAKAALWFLSRWLTRMAGLAVGYGTLENVADAYGFIVERYRPGDRIYLVGFSRGALTVRLIGGLLHRIGVLRPDAISLVPYALELYGQHLTLIPDKDKRCQARAVIEEFRKTFCFDGSVCIRFLGAWDTVKSFGVLTPQSFPHMRHNPSVRTVRHAIALDERRRFFIFTSWGGLRDFVEAGPPGNQEVEEVWFAGDHADIGGGHPENESGLSWYSFRWMVGEARYAEVKFDDKKLSKMMRSAMEGRSACKCFFKRHKMKGWYRLLDPLATLLPFPDLVNSPSRARYPSVHLQEDLSVPPGWPKRSCLPKSGNRHPEAYRRNDAGGALLLHWSVKQFVVNGKYKTVSGRELDLGNVSYVDDKKPCRCVGERD